jgi:hypothetical protein
MKKLLLVFLGIFLLSSMAWGFTYEERFHQTYDIPKGGTFSLYNPTGNVKITQWNRDEIDVLAIKRSSRSKADLKRVKIEVKEGKSMMVRSVYQKNANVGVNYEIKVPAGIRLERIENVTGNLEIDGVNECTDVKVITGNLTVESDSGPVKAETVTGNLKIYLNKITGNADYRIITGQLEIYLNPEIDASIDANVTTGSFANHGLKLMVEELSGIVNKHFQGTLGKGGNKIDLQVVTGGIGLYKL